MNPVIIIGGGPSGMMAAISAKTKYPNLDVILIEKNPQLGLKLSLTGGKRCNVTANLDNQAIIDNVVKNGKFLYSSLNNFNAKDIISFFNQNNCKLKEEDHNRMFPVSNQSSDIIATLLARLNKLKVKILLNTEVLNINPNTNQITIPNKTLKYHHLIIATGGITFPKTGSTGSGYQFAKEANHTVTELLPAEVPLVSNSAVIQNKTLQGLSFNDVTLTVLNGNKPYKKITHDLIFTHFGLSGPAALRASFYIQELLTKNNNQPVDITIDFIPSLTSLKLESLTDEQIKQLEIPKRLLDYLKNNYQDYKTVLKCLPLTIYTTKGFSQAFVTNGGVSLKEVDAKTLRSKLNPSISFCGEVLDLNAFTGGFNITMALSTGYTAGLYANNLSEE